MKWKILLAISVFGVAVASAKSYSVNLSQPALLGTTELAAGDYKVEVNDQKAVIRNGKIQTECPVKVESAGNKYNATAVRYSTTDGKMHIQEIHIGGTNTKLVFNE
ncbi:MAG: hypothetical protein LAP40_01725 [Acidobacteriia bacterium]|nr:hypothetical protein [Terriglobia bacterium]